METITLTYLSLDLLSNSWESYECDFNWDSMLVVHIPSAYVLVGYALLSVDLEDSYFITHRILSGGKHPIFSTEKPFPKTFVTPRVTQHSVKSFTYKKVT